MERKYKTSERISILNEEGEVLLRGAIVRNFNSETATYHVTLRTEEEGLLSFHLPQQQLLAEG